MQALPEMATHHLVKFVIVAAVFQWLLGAFWYGVMFKKSWRTLIGLPEGEKPKNMVFGMVISFVGCLVLSFCLAHIVRWAGSTDFISGAAIAIICWLGFMAPPLYTQHVYEKRRANLFAINACYWLLTMALGGGILAAFH
jgi:hypothetical protein